MIRHIIPKIRSAASLLGALLSESAQPCPICRMAALGVQLHPEVREALPADAPLQGICRACAAGIEWIGPIACAVCGRPDPCDDCARRGNAHFVCSRSAVRYNDRIREWLALFKYRGDERMAKPLADMLDIAWRRLDLTLQSRQPSHRWDAVIPVPVSAERMAERGFNQAELLAALLCGRRGLPLRKLLVRTRHSEKKSLQSRLARLKSAEGLFVADDAAVRTFLADLSARDYGLIAPSDAESGFRSRQHSILPQRKNLSRPATASLGPHPIRLLIVDDIYTTGSTIEACSEALMAALRHYEPERNIHVYAVTLARS